MVLTGMIYRMSQVLSARIAAANSYNSLSDLRKGRHVVATGYSPGVKCKTGALAEWGN
jgi:hypothetical protein